MKRIITRLGNELKQGAIVVAILLFCLPSLMAHGGQFAKRAAMVYAIVFAAFVVARMG